MRCGSVLYCIGLLILLAIEPSKTQTSSEQVVRYFAANGSIVGHNIDRFNNRPLYVYNTNALVLAGDRPIIRFAHHRFLLGTFMAALVRGDRGKWLQQCDEITSMYRSGQMTWKISDASLPGVTVRMDVLPAADTIGLAVRIRIDGAQQGDRLLWVYGGVQFRDTSGLGLHWKYDPLVQQSTMLSWGFTPEDCRRNAVSVDGKAFVVSVPDTTVTPNTVKGVVGYTTAESACGVGDASLWDDLPAFGASSAGELPIVRGVAEVENGKDTYWSVQAFTGSDRAQSSRMSDPRKAFVNGAARTEEFAQRVKLHTPDSCLNTLASNLAAAIDGRWYPPVFVHGTMQWNSPLVGWRTIFGATMIGWHDRVQTQAKYYIGHQITASDKKEAVADTNFKLVLQAPSSRFYGAGFINKDQYIYNMQTQFFDQLIEEWRFTADPDLEKILLPALELHLTWMRECFDPDGDGIYESYINTWPTDSQWYNGGGTAEQTSYAYRAHGAARDLARRQGDVAAARRHGEMMERIAKGFFAKLWIKAQGHAGSYREQGGHERLHTDPWLYSIFLPIDAKLTSPLQALESVYYSEWALQNDVLPLGGRMVWSSNWMPAKWSVRVRYPGDNWALALSYFQAGLPDDGWDVMRGTFMRSAFAEVVPGNFGTSVGGTDFGDCADMFARALVQGLFGYNPDCPNGAVKIAPQFPSDWNDAWIELKDVKIAFERSEGRSSYTVQLTRAANLDLRLPIVAQEIRSISVDGKPTLGWKVLPGVGSSIVHIELGKTTGSRIDIETDRPLPYHPPVILEGNVAETVRLVAEQARIVGWEDPQNVLEGAALSNGVLRARLSRNAGSHTVVARVVGGKTPQWRIFRVKVNDPVSEAKNKKRFIAAVPTNTSWATVDISRYFNADVRSIYQQKYLTPRPNTVSARLGTDGYSPWTFPLWRLPVPEIKLDSARSDNGVLMTPQRVPFQWSGEKRNIAFTSMWDNFPRKITVPVKKTGDAVWFLVAGSSNPMQCQIANAIIRLRYSDGQRDSLELVPPENYWSLCALDDKDYTTEVDRFCLPALLPDTVQLGKNCRAILLNLRLKKGVELQDVTLETLSQEVVVGLMGVTVGSLHEDRIHIMHNGE